MHHNLPRIEEISPASISSDYRQIQDEMMFEVQKGNLQALDSVFQSNSVDVNYQNSDGNTALIFATQNRHLQIVSYLLQIQNIDVNLANNNGFFPLFIAAIKGYVEIAQKLLQCQFIDVNKQVSVGTNPTTLVAVAGYSALINPLGFKFFANNSTEETALDALLEKHEIEIWGQKQDCDGIDERVLVRPELSVYRQVIQLLLLHKDIEIEQGILQGGQTALLQACGYGHAIFVEQLLQKGANIEAVSARSKTALNQALASKIDTGKKIKLLLKYAHRWPQSMLDDALSLAATRGDPQIFGYILQTCKADINCYNSSGQTPLTIAAEHGHVEIVKVLLNCANIEVNKNDGVGFTPLYFAACNGHLQIVEELLNHPEIDVNQQFGRNNKTVLMRICGYTALVRKQSGWKLLGQGQGIMDMRDFDTGDINSLVVQSGQEIKSETKIHVQSGKHKQACTKISIYSCIMQVILSHKKTNIDAQDTEGKTALMHACAAGHATFVQQLISNNADINIQSCTCQTALHEAIQSNLERTEKLDILLMQPHLQINLQGLTSIWLNNTHLLVSGNALVFSIIEGFSSDNISAIKDLLFSASKTECQFDVNISWGNDQCDGVPEEFKICDSILKLVVKFEKYALTSQIMEGLSSGKINPQQLPHIVKILPTISDKKKFHPILAQYLNSEIVILQRLANGFPQFRIILQEKIVKFLSELVEHGRDYSVFQSKIVGAAVLQLWQGFAQWYLRFQAALFFIFLILNFSIAVIHTVYVDNNINDSASDKTVVYLGNLTYKCVVEQVPDENQNPDCHPMKFQKILWLNFALASIMLITEFLQIDYSYIRILNFKLGLREYFTQIMALITCIQGIANILDWFIIFGGLSLPLFWNQQIEAFFAFYIIILFFRGLLWLLPNRNLGHLILIIGLIIWKTAQFVFLTILFLLVFSLSFKILNINLAGEDYPQFQYQFFAVMLGLFGDIELDEFFSKKSPRKEMGLLLLVFFIIFIPLLLINLLISLMTLTYEGLSSQRDSIFIRNKAVIILEVHRVIKNLRYMFPFLQINNNKQNSNIVVVNQGLDSGTAQEKTNYDMLLFDSLKRMEQILERVSQKQQVTEMNVSKRLKKVKTTQEDIEAKLRINQVTIEQVQNSLQKVLNQQSHQL